MDDEVVRAAVVNGDARYAAEPSAPEPRTALDVKVEDELPPKPEVKPPGPPLVPPEPSEKQKPAEKKPELKKAVSTPPAEKPRDVEKNISASPQDAEKVKKRQSFLTRTLWTFIMIGGFIGTCSLGSATFRGAELYCRPASDGPCLYDCPRLHVPNAGIPRSHCAILSQAEAAR